MKKEYIKGKGYQSTTHGLVTYLGIDTYKSQESMKFESSEHGVLFWLPGALPWHFKEETFDEQEKSPSDLEFESFSVGCPWRESVTYGYCTVQKIGIYNEDLDNSCIRDNCAPWHFVKKMKELKH